MKNTIDKLSKKKQLKAPFKVFSAEFLFFHLPDDFEGGISDALRLMADYHDKAKGTGKQEVGGSVQSQREKFVEEWYAFLQSVLEKNKKLHGGFSISEFDEENNKMERMDEYWIK